MFNHLEYKLTLPLSMFQCHNQIYNYWLWFFINLLHTEIYCTDTDQADMKISIHYSCNENLRRRLLPPKTSLNLSESSIVPSLDGRLSSASFFLFFDLSFFGKTTSSDSFAAISTSSDAFYNTTQDQCRNYANTDTWIKYWLSTVL
jgi:hypothetical protein